VWTNGIEAAGAPDPVFRFKKFARFKRYKPGLSGTKRYGSMPRRPFPARFKIINQHTFPFGWNPAFFVKLNTRVGQMLSKASKKYKPKTPGIKLLAMELSELPGKSYGWLRSNSSALFCTWFWSQHELLWFP